MAGQVGGRPPSSFCEGKNCPSTSDPDGPRIGKAGHNPTEKLEYIILVDHRAPLLTNTDEPVTFGITLCPTCVTTLVCRCRIGFIPPSEDAALDTEPVATPVLLGPDQELTHSAADSGGHRHHQIPKEALVQTEGSGALLRDKCGVEYGHLFCDPEAKRFEGRPVKIRISGTYLKFITGLYSGNSPDGYLFSGAVVGQSLNRNVTELEVYLTALDRVVMICPSKPPESDDLMSFDPTGLPTGVPFSEGLDDSGNHWSSAVASHFGETQMNKVVSDLESAAEMNYPVTQGDSSDRNAMGQLNSTGAGMQMNQHFQQFSHSTQGTNVFQTPSTSPFSRSRLRVQGGYNSNDFGSYPSQQMPKFTDFISSKFGLLNSQRPEQYQGNFNTASRFTTRSLEMSGTSPVTCPTCSGHHNFLNWQIAECRNAGTGLVCPGCGSRIEMGLNPSNMFGSHGSGSQGGPQLTGPLQSQLHSAHNIFTSHIPSGHGSQNYNANYGQQGTHQNWQDAQGHTWQSHPNPGKPSSDSLPKPDKPPDGPDPPGDDDEIGDDKNFEKPEYWNSMALRGMAILEASSNLNTENSMKLEAYREEMRQLGHIITGQSHSMCNSLENMAEKMNASKDGLLQPKSRDLMLKHVREGGRHGESTPMSPISPIGIGLYREDLIRILHGTACCGRYDFVLSPAMAYSLSVFDFGETTGGCAETIFEDFRSILVHEKYKHTETAYPLSITKNTIKRVGPKPAPVKDKSDLIDIGMNMAKFFGELLGEPFYYYGVVWLENIVKLIEKDMVTNSWNNPPRVSSLINTLLKAWCRRIAEWSAIITNGGNGDFYFTATERALAKRFQIPPIPYLSFCEQDDPVFRVNYSLFYERKRNMAIDQLVHQAEKIEQKSSANSGATQPVVTKRGKGQKGLKGRRGKGSGFKGKGKSPRLQTTVGAWSSYMPQTNHTQSQTWDGYASPYVGSWSVWPEASPNCQWFDPEAEHEPSDEDQSQNDHLTVGSEPNLYSPSYPDSMSYGDEQNWSGEESGDSSVGHWVWSEVGGYSAPEDDQGYQDPTVYYGDWSETSWPEGEFVWSTTAHQDHEVGAVLDPIDRNSKYSSFPEKPRVHFNLSNGKGGKGFKGKGEKGKPKGSVQTGLVQNNRPTELSWPSSQFRLMCENSTPVDANGKQVCLAFNCHSRCPLVGYGRQCPHSHLPAVSDFSLAAHCAAVPHGDLLWLKKLPPVVQVRQLILKSRIEEYNWINNKKSGDVGRSVRLPEDTLNVISCPEVLHKSLLRPPVSIESVHVLGTKGHFDLQLRLLDYGADMGGVDDSCFFLGVSQVYNVHPLELSNNIHKSASESTSLQGSIGAHARLIESQCAYRAEHKKGKIQVDALRLFMPASGADTLLVALFKDTAGNITMPRYRSWGSSPSRVAFVWVESGHLRFAQVKDHSGNFKDSIPWDTWQPMQECAEGDGIRTYNVWCNNGARLDSKSVGSPHQCDFLWFYNQYDVEKKIRDEVSVDVGSTPFTIVESKEANQSPFMEEVQAEILSELFPCPFTIGEVQAEILSEFFDSLLGDSKGTETLKAQQTDFTHSIPLFNDLGTRLLQYFFGAVSECTGIHPMEIYRMLCDRPTLLDHMIPYPTWFESVRASQTLGSTLGPYVVVFVLKVDFNTADLHNLVTQNLLTYVDHFEETYEFKPAGFPYNHPRSIEVGYSNLEGFKKQPHSPFFRSRPPPHRPHIISPDLFHTYFTEYTEHIPPGLRPDQTEHCSCGEFSFWPCKNMVIAGQLLCNSCKKHNQPLRKSGLKTCECQCQGCQSYDLHAHHLETLITNKVYSQKSFEPIPASRMQDPTFAHGNCYNLELIHSFGEPHLWTHLWRFHDKLPWQPCTFNSHTSYGKGLFVFRGARSFERSLNSTIPFNYSLCDSLQSVQMSAVFDDEFLVGCIFMSLNSKGCPKDWRISMVRKEGTSLLNFVKANRFMPSVCKPLAPNHHMLSMVSHQFWKVADFRVSMRLRNSTLNESQQLEDDYVLDTPSGLKQFPELMSLYQYQEQWVMGLYQKGKNEIISLLTDNPSNLGDREAYHEAMSLVTNLTEEEFNSIEDYFDNPPELSYHSGNSTGVGGIVFELSPNRSRGLEASKPLVHTSDWCDVCQELGKHTHVCSVCELRTRAAAFFRSGLGPVCAHCSLRSCTRCKKKRAIDFFDLDLDSNSLEPQLLTVCFVCTGEDTQETVINIPEIEMVNPDYPITSVQQLCSCTVGCKCTNRGELSEHYPNTMYCEDCAVNHWLNLDCCHEVSPVPISIKPNQDQQLVGGAIEQVQAEVKNLGANNLAQTNIFTHHEFDDIFTASREFGTGTRWNFVVSEVSSRSGYTPTEEVKAKLKAWEIASSELARKLKLMCNENLITGDSSRSQQHEYSNHLDTWGRLCLKVAASLLAPKYWIQFLVASLRDLNVTGECVPAQSWPVIEKTFSPVLSANHLAELRRVVIDGYSVHVEERGSRARGKLHKSAKDRKREIYSQLWKDASSTMLLFFPPKSLDLMSIGEIECCAYGRVEKHSTATGLPKGTGRLIHDLSYNPVVNGIAQPSLNSRISSEYDHEDRYYLPRHLDYIMKANYLSQFSEGLDLQINKFDVTGAFRNVGQALFSLATIAGEIDGSTAIELVGVFGFKKMPVIYHTTATVPIDRKHNSLWMVLPESGLSSPELDSPNTLLPTVTLEEAVELGVLNRIIPLCSSTFVDDTGKVMIKKAALINTCDTAAADTIKARFGCNGLSWKDPQEMKAENQQTITGITMNVAEKWMEPTIERVRKGIRYLIDRIPKILAKCITAREMFEVYCLWQWIATAERRIRPLVHTLKRALEGVSCMTHPDDLVTPASIGDDAPTTSEKWAELHSACLALVWLGKEFVEGKSNWNCSFWQALPVYDRLTSEGATERIHAIQKDASMGGMGAINITRCDYFYLKVPGYLTEEIREVFSHGFTGDKNKLTMGLCELGCRILSQFVWGSASPLPHVDLNIMRADDHITPIEWPITLWIQEDNVGAEVHGERGWTTSSRGQGMLIAECTHEMMHQTQKVTTGVRSSDNVSDAPSRFWTKDGEWDVKVVLDFIKEVDENNLNLKEIVIPNEWVDLVFNDDKSRDLIEHIKRTREITSTFRPSILSWEKSKANLLMMNERYKPTVGNQSSDRAEKPNFHHITSPLKLEFLIPHPSIGLLNLDSKPTLTAFCYGSLNSCHGWIAEDFVLSQRAEVAVWATQEADRLYPDAKELNNLDNVNPEDIIATDALQMGLPCQFLSALGNIRGSKHCTGHLFLGIIRKSLLVGFKVIVIEEVLGIISYANGFYYKAALDLVNSFGYEMSSRNVNSWDHGLPQARFRIIIIITNPRYGPHSNLGILENLRRPSDPICVNDIALNHDEVTGVEFFDSNTVHWFEGASAGLGRATTLGSLGKGGPGWIGTPDRTVRDSLSPSSPIPTTLNSGAYLFNDGTIRSLNLEESILCQGLMTTSAATLLGYSGAAIQLPNNYQDACMAVGNGESARQSQSVARAVKYFLDTASHLPPGLLPTPNESFVSSQCCPHQYDAFWSREELDLWEANQLRHVIPGNVLIRDELLIHHTRIKNQSDWVGGFIPAVDLSESTSVDLSIKWWCIFCKNSNFDWETQCVDCQGCHNCCSILCVRSPHSNPDSRLSMSPPSLLNSITKVYARGDSKASITSTPEAACLMCSVQTARVCPHCFQCNSCCQQHDICPVCESCDQKLDAYCSACHSTWCKACSNHTCTEMSNGGVPKLQVICFLPAIRRVSSVLNNCLGKLRNFTPILNADCYLTVDQGLITQDCLSSGSFNPALRDYKRKFKDRPAGLETPELKEDNMIHDNFIVSGERVLNLLDLCIPSYLTPFLHLCTRLTKSIDPARHEFKKLECLKNCCLSTILITISKSLSTSVKNWLLNRKYSNSSVCANPGCPPDHNSDINICGECLHCSICCASEEGCKIGEKSRMIGNWTHIQRTNYLCSWQCTENELDMTSNLTQQETWSRANTLARSRPISELVQFESNHPDSSMDVGANGFGYHRKPDYNSHTRFAAGPTTLNFKNRFGQSSVFKDRPGLNPYQSTPQKNFQKENYRPQTQPHNRQNQGPRDFLYTQEQPKPKSGKSKRARYVMNSHDQRLLNYEAELTGSALEDSTENKSYLPSWNMFKEVCSDLEMNSALTGTNKREDEDTLVKYVAFEYGFHNNAYSTIRVKLYGIRWFTMEAGYADPLESKPRLKRVLKGLKKLRGTVNRKKPLTPKLLTNLVKGARGKGLEAAAVSTAIQIAFFFLLRVSEFAAQDSTHMSKFIMRRCDVKFKKNGSEVTASEVPDEVELFIRGSKTDSSLQGCYRSHYASGAFLCPVKAMVLWCLLIDGSVLPLDPLFTIPSRSVVSSGVKKNKILTRLSITQALKAFAASDGLSAADISTHSCRSGGATALLRAGVDPAVIQVVGRWASDIFKIYTRYHKGIMSGVASAMAKLQ